MPRLLTRTVLAWSFISLGIAHAESGISIEHAWIRSAPANTNVMAGYLHFINHSSSDITLSKVSSPQFKRVEVHRTRIHDGMMHMENVEPFIVKSKQEVIFEPGGYHLMLIEPHQPLARGDKASLMFDFDNGDHLILDFEVQDAPEDSSSHHHDDNHHMH